MRTERTPVDSSARSRHLIDQARDSGDGAVGQVVRLQNLNVDPSFGVPADHGDLVAAQPPQKLV
jgi:hypothetical protein